MPSMSIPASTRESASIVEAAALPPMECPAAATLCGSIMREFFQAGRGPVSRSSTKERSAARPALHQHQPRFLGAHVRGGGARTAGAGGVVERDHQFPGPGRGDPGVGAAVVHEVRHLGADGVRSGGAGQFECGRGRSGCLRGVGQRVSGGDGRGQEEHGGEGGSGHRRYARSDRHAGDTGRRNRAKASVPGVTPWGTRDVRGAPRWSSGTTPGHGGRGPCSFRTAGRRAAPYSYRGAAQWGREGCLT